jgi:hypothetical protein
MNLFMGDSIQSMKCAIKIRVVQLKNQNYLADALAHPLVMFVDF